MKGSDLAHLGIKKPPRGLRGGNHERRSYGTRSNAPAPASAPRATAAACFANGGRGSSSSETTPTKDAARIPATRGQGERPGTKPFTSRSASGIRKAMGGGLSGNGLARLTLTYCGSHPRARSAPLSAVTRAGIVTRGFCRRSQSSTTILSAVTSGPHMSTRDSAAACVSGLSSWDQAHQAITRRRLHSANRRIAFLHLHRPAGGQLHRGHLRCLSTWDPRRLPSRADLHQDMRVVAWEAHEVGRLLHLPVGHVGDLRQEPLAQEI